MAKPKKRFRIIFGYFGNLPLPAPYLAKHDLFGGGVVLKQPLRKEDAMKHKVVIEMPPVKIGKALTAQWTLGEKGMQCEWDPEVPTVMTRQMKRRYLESQRTFMSKLADVLQQPVVIYGLNGPETLYPKNYPGSGGVPAEYEQQQRGG